MKSEMRPYLQFWWKGPDEGGELTGIGPNEAHVSASEVQTKHGGMHLPSSLAELHARLGKPADWACRLGCGAVLPCRCVILIWFTQSTEDTGAFRLSSRPD